MKGAATSDPAIIAAKQKADEAAKTVTKIQSEIDRQAELKSLERPNGFSEAQWCSHRRHSNIEANAHRNFKEQSPTATIPWGHPKETDSMCLPEVRNPRKCAKRIKQRLTGLKV